VVNQKNQTATQISSGDYALKKLLDIPLALVGVVLALPLWLVFSLAIKLGDGGPIFFTQNRWGKNKRIIRAYKFRTMVPNAIERFGHLQAQERDTRITRVGRLLRATSLDESPQLLNILKGEMSWVGPRVIAINEAQTHGKDKDLPDDSIPGFELRSKLIPGLTGVAQIYAPRNVSRRNKFRYDLIYFRKQSLSLDVRLIFLSVWITLRAKWQV